MTDAVLSDEERRAKELRERRDQGARLRQAREAAGFREAAVAPPAAFYSADFGEYMLKYDDVRASPDPDADLLAFLQTTYAAAADLGGWDRPALERAPEPLVP